MPKVSYIKAHETPQAKAEKSAAMLFSWMLTNCKNCDQLGKQMGKSRSTAEARRQKPLRMELDEISSFCTAQGIELEIAMKKDGTEVRFTL